MARFVWLFKILREERMKKTFVITGILAAGFFLSIGHGRELHLEGHSVSACFDSLGNLILAYESPSRGIICHQATPLTGSTLGEISLLRGGEAGCPVIKNDGSGRLWLAWEQPDTGGRQIYRGLLSREGMTEILCLSQEWTGENLSPDLIFDARGNPWILWINRDQGLSRLIVCDGLTGQSWQVNTLPQRQIYSPRGIADEKGAIWAFWVSTEEDTNAIFSCRLKGSLLSAPLRVHESRSSPQLMPSVCLDEEGRLWTAWSGYDGNDYEIYLSTWNGSRWSPALQVTDNIGLMDVSPCLALSPTGRLVLVWSQAGEESRIVLCARQGSRWSPEVPVSQGNGFNRTPRVETSATHLGIAWENMEEGSCSVKARIFPLAHLEGLLSRARVNLRPRGRPDNLPQEVLSSDSEDSRNQDMFIAYGDSITLGVLARVYFPDHGYVPRLESLLESRFGKARVLNRGVAGEQTWEGLARITGVLEQDRGQFLLLMEGTIDMVSGVPSETAAFNIEEMVKACLAKGVYPLTATIIPRSDLLWNNLAPSTLRLNELIQAFLPLYALPLIDQFALFFNEPGGFQSLFSDGAHPNEAGYQKMAQAWFDGISRLPWPPVNITVARTVNQILFYDEHVNIIRWEDNPRLAPDIPLAHTVIARKPASAEGEDFGVMARVEAGTREWLDRDINPSARYIYLLWAENTAGIKGPSSARVRDY